MYQKHKNTNTQIQQDFLHFYCQVKDNCKKKLKIKEIIKNNNLKKKSFMKYNYLILK